MSDGNFCEPVEETSGRPFMAAVMSTGRLGFMDNFFCAFAALNPLGITITKYAGAFWGPCLTRAIEAIVARGTPEWIMTIDYDTVFTLEDVQELIRLVKTHPEVDALAPLQMHRMENRPLLSINGDNGKPLAQIPADQLIGGEVLKISTAHMGCMVMKTEKLLNLPKPWFWSSPDPEGGWGEGRVEDDTYFWRKWEAAGNSLYLAHHVPVGHCELMVRWPNPQWGVMHQHPSAFWATGKPVEIWR